MITDLPRQIKILQEILKIPVTNLIDHDQVVTVISGNVTIGNISYVVINVMPELITFDTEYYHLNTLNWPAVYRANADIINEKIQELIPDKDPIVTIGNFRRLYVNELVNNVQTLLFAVECVYDGREWNVFQEVAPQG